MRNVYTDDEKEQLLAEYTRIQPWRQRKEIWRKKYPKVPAINLARWARERGVSLFDEYTPKNGKVKKYSNGKGVVLPEAGTNATEPVGMSVDQLLHSIREQRDNLNQMIAYIEGISK